MATASEPSAQLSSDFALDVPATSVPMDSTPDDGASADTHSTRLMLTTAAHFVQQHLHSQLAELGLTPIDLSVLSGLAELREATAEAIAAQCILSDSVSEQSLAELGLLGFVETRQGVHAITDAGSKALADARTLEDALFAETSSTLRLELSSLISRLRDGGVLESE